jgi:Preprotein translocase subunit SecB
MPALGSAKSKRTKQRGETKATGQLSPSSKVDDRVEIDYSRLTSISGVIQLKDISLIGTSFRSMLDPRKVAADPSAHGSEFLIKNSDARWWRDGTLFEVVLGYDIAAALRRDDGHPNGRLLFQLNVTWIVTYSLPKDFRRPKNHEDVAADFVFANAQINVFPFLRQLVIDVTAKAGWMPLLLPVFRAPKHRPLNLVRNAPAWEPPAEDDRNAR